MDKYLTNMVGETILNKVDKEPLVYNAQFANAPKYNEEPYYKQSSREELGYTRPPLPWSDEVVKKAKASHSPISPLLHWTLSATPEEKASQKFDLSRWHHGEKK